MVLPGCAAGRKMQLSGQGIAIWQRNEGCGRRGMPEMIIQVGERDAGGTWLFREKVKALNLTIQSLSTSEGIRTPVSALRGPRARPLHNGGI